MGSVLVINGIVANTDAIIADAKGAANGANLHQLATVVEVYYLDHNHYPEAHSGEELIKLLEQENYILNRPLEPSIFHYQSFHRGQDYSLKLGAN